MEIRIILFNYTIKKLKKNLSKKVTQQIESAAIFYNVYPMQ